MSKRDERLAAADPRIAEMEQLITELRRLAVAEAYGLKTTSRPWHLHEGDLVNAEHKDVYWAESEVPDTDLLLFAVNHIEQFAITIEDLLTRLAEAHAALRRIYELQIDSEDFGTSSPEELYANKLNAIEAIAREGLGHE